jgi:hypothetical protein
LLMPPTCDDFVLCSARGKFGVVHVGVANHCPRLDSLYAGCIRHGSYPWQIGLYVAGRGDDLWAVGASRAPHSRQATRQQNHPSFELGHSQNQIRPPRVKVGQYQNVLPVSVGYLNPCWRGGFLGLDREEDAVNQIWIKGHATSLRTGTVSLPRVPVSPAIA